MIINNIGIASSNSSCAWKKSACCSDQEPNNWQRKQAKIPTTRKRYIANVTFVLVCGYIYVYISFLFLSSSFFFSFTFNHICSYGDRGVAFKKCLTLRWHTSTSVRISAQRHLMVMVHIYFFSVNFFFSSELEAYTKKRDR